MRYDLYLLQYNNYYNRQLKMSNTIEDYLPYLIIKLEDRNIDIVDSINTKITVNYSATDILNDTPNYLLLHDKTANKVTRWFVIEAIMTRGCQYELTIRRDVIADYFDTVRRSPCLIQKGYVDNDNVLVFNKEQQEYNKIKTKELLIKDNTGIGYVVGFIGKDVAGSASNKIYSSYSSDRQVDFDYDSLSSSMKQYFAIGNATPGSITEDRTMSNIIINSVGLNVQFGVQNQGDMYINNNGLIPIYRSLTDSDYNCEFAYTSGNVPNTHLLYKSSRNKYYDYTSTPALNTARDDLIKPVYNQMRTTITSKLNNQNVNYDSVLNVDRAFINSLRSYDNKICKINNVYYRCTFMKVANGTGSKVNDNYSFTYNIRYSLPSDSDLASYTGGYYNLRLASDNLTSSDITINYGKYNCYIKLTQEQTSIYTYLTPKANRNHLIDAPYDMFVLPYDDNYTYTVNATNYLSNKNMAINLAQSICEASGANATYDIQIVPYCPFDIIYNDWSLFNYQAIYNASDNVIGYYFWADKASKSINIAENRLELTLSNNPSYKEITQLNKYILCSPDKNAQWEFNPAMNHGITNWIISYEYRPFSSYIKIEPEFNWLYGNSYYNNLSDMRGLIINGSYSLTQLNDAWATYINNNKNYQQIFDTQINTQIKQYDVQNKAAWDTMFARSFDIGFLGTGMLTSPIRAYYNTKEQQMNEELQGISLASQRKLFNYQLDNIQNQPDTLKKLTSINIDFRIFPFVEIYESTEQEQLIFRDSIRYNGMTIMSTGYIENYLNPDDETFIQATLIRFNEYIGQENDFTLVQAINNELNQGIYITKE